MNRRSYRLDLKCLFSTLLVTSMAACTSTSGADETSEDEADDAGSLTPDSPTAESEGGSPQTGGEDVAEEAGASEGGSEGVQVDGGIGSNSGTTPNESAPQDAAVTTEAADAGALQDAAVDDLADAAAVDDGLRVLPLKGPVEIDQAPFVLSEGYLTDLPISPFEHLRLCDDGSLLGYAQGALTKIEANGTLAWQRSTANDFLPNTLSTVHAVVLTPECETLLGGGTNAGLPEHAYVGAGDAFVLRVDSDGELAWTHQWGSSSTESVSGIALAQDGSFFTTGPCEGQVPGSPADYTGYPFVERFDAAGTSLSLLQHAPHPDGSLVSPSGLQGTRDQYYRTGMGALANAAIATFESDGAPEAYAELVVQQTVTDEIIGTSTLPVRLTPLVDSGYHETVDAFYGLASLLPSALDALSALGDHGLPLEAFSVGVTRFSSQGKLAWMRAPEQLQAILDPETGSTWTGRFNSLDHLLLADDAIYVAGTYTNTYAGGAVVPPSTFPGFIGRYDLDGERVWFTQVLLGQQSDGEPLPPLNMSPLILNAAGNLQAYFQSPGTAAWYVAEFDVESGEAL